MRINARSDIPVGSAPGAVIEEETYDEEEEEKEEKEDT
jgi:hypothetical protein